MSKRAVLVGINYVGQKNELKGCVNDALAMRDLLMQKYGFLAPDVRVFVDDTNAARGVPTGLPTRANIMASLEWLVTNVRRGDHLIFTFSGHGVQSGKDASGDEADGRDECFLFSDGVLTDDDFARMVLMRVPVGVKMTVITDCCHSATLCDLRFCYHMDPTTNAMRRLSHQKATAPIGDVISLSAALDAQTASDGAFEGKWVVIDGRRQWQWGDSHGAFTWSLLKVLEAANYGPVQVEDLLQRVHEYVSKTLKKTQVPHVSVAREQLLKTTAF